MREPVLRFKQNDGNSFPSWKEVKLSDILVEYKETHEKDGVYEHVSLTKEGVVPKSDRYDRDFLVTTDSKKYRITHLNDICYNPANLKFGVICRNKYGDAIFSPIYVTYRIKEGYLPEFVEMLVTNDRFIQRALKYQQGTVYERMSVSSEDLVSLRVAVPGIEEQKKIAEFYLSLDAIISESELEIQNLEIQKEHAIREVFLKNVRFKRKDGTEFPDWEVMRFGDHFSFKNGVNASRDAFRSGQVKCIGVSDVYKCLPIKSENINGTVSLTEKEYSRYAVDYGDILFQRSSETQSDIGHASVYVDNTMAVFNGFVICAKPTSLFYNPVFMHYMMQTDDVRTQTIRLGAGAQHFNIGQDSLASLAVSMPCIEEQECIAAFLSDFDAAIEAAKREKKLWIEMKKGLLQQMFV